MMMHGSPKVFICMNCSIHSMLALNVFDCCSVPFCLTLATTENKIRELEKIMFNKLDVRVTVQTNFRMKLLISETYNRIASVGSEPTPFKLCLS